MSVPGALPGAPSATALLPGAKALLPEAFPLAEAAGGNAWLCSGAASEAVLNAASEALGMLKRGEMPASISSRESALHSLIQLSMRDLTLGRRKILCCQSADHNVS